jgi:putative tricarboxylic transport membrane protein
MEFHETHEKRRGEDLFNLVVLLVGVVLFWQSYAIAGFSALSSPGAFPLAASAVMVLAALIVVIGNLRRRSTLSDDVILPVTTVAFVGLVVAYAVALVPLGFLPASFLFLLLGTKLLHRRSWLSAFVMALGALVVVYIAFRLVFQVVLPEGVVPERELMARIGNVFSGSADQ